MMDAFSDPLTPDIVIMSSAQVGKSEVLLNCVGYLITHDPCPILLLQPTVDLAEDFSRRRIAPMLRDTPVLAAKVTEAKSRDSGNTLLHKEFPGGQLALAGANSPASLASRPIRVVVADEIDKYPISAGTEGDPMSLAEKRTTTFWNRKRVKVSTPSVKGASRIEAAYLESDRRKFYVPCPHCDERQVLLWANVRWPEGMPERALYYCPHCGGEWSEGQRAEAVSEGEWRGTAPFTGIAGFHISEIYSPWVTLAEMAKAFILAKDSPTRLQTWINSSLGEVWETSKDLLEPSALMKRAEDYKLARVMPEALLVTAGVDVQADRLECYVWGFGPGEESWVIDAQVFVGNPSEQIVWDQLLAYLEQPLEHDRGAQVIPRVVAVDSGYATQDVYAFCRKNQMRRLPAGMQQIIAVKGREGTLPVIGKPTLQDIDSRGTKIKRGVQLFIVGVDQIKTMLYGRMKIETPGAGFMHFSNELREDFYDQLAAEKLVTKWIKGFARVEWHLPKGRRNEALDCAVYAYAAATLLGLQRFKAPAWDLRRRQMTAVRPSAPAEAPLIAGDGPAAQPPAPPMPPAMVRPQPGPPRRKKNWVTGW